MNRKLTDTLAQVGKPTETWTSTDGSQALVLPYGGRILGLFAPGKDENFFWTHPALGSVATASTFYQSSKWHNSGGDRTWFAPEIDFFLPNYPNLDTYWQPREFDPGNYRVFREHDSIGLTNRFTYSLSRSKENVSLQVSKRLAPALNPLRHLGWTTGLEYAGYSLQTSLEFTAAPGEMVKVGIWSLLQLPHGGELLMSTHSKAKPKVLFGSIDAADLLVGEHLIRYRMRAQGEHKLGVEAPTIVGRVGYLFLNGAASSLVIRNFSTNPSGEYVDVPWSAPESPGSAVQACNINSELGAFSELEYHVPAIGGPEGESACGDVSQLWAFRGKKEEIIRVARFLIDAEL